MYSNQKDQIKLEEVYNKVHNELVTEDANETLGGSVVYVAITLVPLMIEYLQNRYGSSFDINDLKQKINSFLSNETIRKDLQHQGIGYVKSNFIKMLKSVKGVTEQQGKAITDIQNIFPEDNNQNLIQKAKSFLTNAIGKQKMQNMQNNVKRDLEVNRPLRTGFRG